MLRWLASPSGHDRLLHGPRAGAPGHRLLRSSMSWRTVAWRVAWLVVGVLAACVGYTLVQPLPLLATLLLFLLSLSAVWLTVRPPAWARPVPARLQVGWMTSDGPDRAIFRLMVGDRPGEGWRPVYVDLEPVERRPE